MSSDSLIAPMKDAEHLEIGGVTIDTVRAGAARVRRVIYPKGFRWSSHIKQTVKTDLCQHSHVGMLVRGEIHVRYGDGCTKRFVAPQVVAVEPDHDAWVEGNEPAVLIEFDFEGQTIQKMGMPAKHEH